MHTEFKQNKTRQNNIKRLAGAVTFFLNLSFLTDAKHLFFLRKFKRAEGQNRINRIFIKEYKA